MIAGSAFLPAPAYRQEGGVSSRLAREAYLAVRRNDEECEERSRWLFFSNLKGFNRHNRWV